VADRPGLKVTEYKDEHAAKHAWREQLISRYIEPKGIAWPPKTKQRTM
jgi:hypothetical protein